MSQDTVGLLTEPWHGELMPLILASLPLYEGVLNVFQCIFLFVLLQKVFFIDPFVAVQHLNQNLIFCVLNVLHQSNLKWFRVVASRKQCC